MVSQVFLNLTICVFLCFIMISASPTESKDEIQSMEKAEQLSCNTHRNCVCLEGLPLCYYAKCFCMYSGQVAETVHEGIVELTETTTEKTQPNKE